MTQITVSGVGIERAPAERATVVVQTVHRAEHPEEAIRVVSEAHRVVCDEVRAFASSDAVERWHADRVWVSHQELWVGDGQRRELVFDASASVHATFRDVDALGAWIGRVATQPVHQVGGIRWSLSEETAAEMGTRARAGAIGDARRKAADLAAAAGLPEPSIVAIREGLDDDAGPAAPRMQAMALRAGGADAAAAIELEGGDIEVSSAVRVDFDA